MHAMMCNDLRLQYVTKYLRLAVTMGMAMEIASLAPNGGDNGDGDG